MGLRLRSAGGLAINLPRSAWRDNRLDVEDGVRVRVIPRNVGVSGTSTMRRRASTGGPCGEPFHRAFASPVKANHAPISNEPHAHRLRRVEFLGIRCPARMSECARGFHQVNQVCPRAFPRRNYTMK